MTKEETIDYIIPAIKNYWNDKICDDIIKTLAQEPCKDAISRKWIKEAIHNFYKGLNHIPTEEDIQRYIEVAPSVTPQPKESEQEPVLDKIKSEIKQAAVNQFQIAMGVADLNERYTHIQMENAYRHSLNVIDKYRESANKE